jgi:hypothetical protein
MNTARLEETKLLFHRLIRRLSSRDLMVVMVIVVVSLFLHYAYLTWIVPPDSPTGGHVDVWGDGVHFWLLSYLTATHGFVYQDLKPNGLQIIWLPLHPLITATVMKLSGDYSLGVIHSLSTLYGTLAAVVSYYLCKRLYSGAIGLAFAAGIGLAFNAWWIAFSSEGIVEPLLSLMLLFALYFWVKGDMLKVLAVVFIGGFVKYEAWFFSGMLLLASVYFRRVSAKTFAAFVAAILTPVAVWSMWSWSLTGNPLAWYAHQVDALTWDVNFLGRWMSPLKWLHYPTLILVMTAGIFFLGVIVALKQSRAAKTIMAIALAYLAFRSWGYASGWTIPNERFIAPLIPLAYVLAVPVLQRSTPGRRRRVLYAVGLMLIILVPFVTQIGVPDRLSYVYYPQIRAGRWLQDHYNNGTVVCDLATVIGYSFLNPRPEDFLSADAVYRGYISHDASLRWLYEYLRSRGVVYYVVTYVAYSASWQLDTASGSRLNLLSGEDAYFFKLVYSDTSPTHWEHNYGVPNLYIYRIQYDDSWLEPGQLPN